MSFTLREVYEYAKGIKKRRALEENQIRRFAYLFASAHRDPKKASPNITEFWPIAILDEAYYQSFGTPQENEEIKAKLIKAWQLSQN